MSGYKIETWIKKGYSEEEAKYQIKIRRPTNVEYWMKKFNLSYEDALKKKLNHQKCASNKSKDRSKEEKRKSAIRCIEYWTSRGYSEEQGRNEISNLQIRDLNYFINKYGVEQGKIKWQNKIDKWQNTLKSKSIKEKQEINSKKSVYQLKNWTNKYGNELGTTKFKEMLVSNGGFVPNNLNDVKVFLLKQINPVDVYLPLSRIVKKIPSYVWQLIKKPDNIEKWLCEFINFKCPYGNIVFKNGKTKPKGLYQMHVDDKLLRSSNEIYFYILLKEKGLKNHIDFEIEREYNNSRMKCDFFLSKGNVYVELVGGDRSSEYKIYLEKMEFKKQTFGSVLLSNQKEYEEYIDKYVKQYYENDNS